MPFQASSVIFCRRKEIKDISPILTKTREEPGFGLHKFLFNLIRSQGRFFKRSGSGSSMYPDSHGKRKKIFFFYQDVPP
jgi:hypothetical protein